MANLLVSHCIWRLFCRFFFQKHNFGSFTIFLYGSSNVGQSQLIFVWPKWCRQVSFFTKRTLGYFHLWGAHLQKTSNPACRQKTTHWAPEWALSSKGEAFKVLLGYGCDMFPQNWVCLDPKNGGIVGVVWNNNWFQGLKKTMWGKLENGNKNASSDSMWLWKANRPVYGTWKYPRNQWNPDLKRFNNIFICDSLFRSPCNNGWVHY